MLELFELILLRKWLFLCGIGVGSWSPASESLVEFPVFGVFIPYMMGYAPDAAFPEDGNVKAMILKDFSWRSAILVFSIEDLLNSSVNNVLLMMILLDLV